MAAGGKCRISPNGPHIGIAFDIAGYRKAKSGIRVWNGSNIKKNDLIALTNWLDWSFNYFRL